MMLDGARNWENPQGKGFVVVLNQFQEKILDLKQKRIRAFTLDEIANDKLRGFRQPIAIDNGALQCLLSETLREIAFLEKKIELYEQLEEKMKTIKNMRKI